LYPIYSVVFSSTKLKNLTKMTRQQLLQPWTRLYYQQYFKYRGGSSTTMVQRW